MSRDWGGVLARSLERVAPAVQEKAMARSPEKETLP